MALRPLVLILPVLLLMPLLASAQGGPPLITDDPGTPGNHNWEINIATIDQLSSSQRYYQFPYLDVNYGLGDHLQLKAEGGYGISEDTGSIYHTGFGTLLFGVKWRFLDQDTAGINVSTYPQYNLHPFFSSTDPELVSPGNQTILPIEASREFGRFAVNPEIGYVLSTQSPDSFFYGLVLAYEAVKDSELLFEFHGSTPVSGGDTDLLINVGTNWVLSEKLSLLFSVGHTLETPEGQDPQILTYLGIQLRL